MRQNASPRSNDLVGLALLALGPILWSLYAWGQRSPDASDVEFALQGGALSQELLRSEPWRIVTAPLLHLDVRHLLTNVFVTVAIGIFAVRQLGGLRVWILIHTSAWIGAAVAMFSPGIVLGISGGFFGVLGSVIGSLLRQEASKRLRELAIMVVLAGLLLAMAPGDVLAHVGGGAAGVIAGWWMTPAPGNQDSESKTLWTIGALIALVNLAACLLVCWKSS